MKFSLLHFFVDILIFFISLIFVSYLKYQNFFEALEKQPLLFSIFFVLFVFISIFNNKYQWDKHTKTKILLKRFFLSNLIFSAFIFSFFYLFTFPFYSRFVVLGHIITIFTLEVGWIFIAQSFINAKIISETYETTHHQLLNMIAENNGLAKNENFNNTEFFQEEDIRKYLIDEVGENVYKYLSKFVNLNTSLNNRDIFVTSTTSKFTILFHPYNFHAIVNLEKINNVRRINKFLESINIKLINNGYYIQCLDALHLRKKRILNSPQYPFVLNFLYYYLIDFLFKRVFPKLPYLKKVYFKITRGRRRVLSFAETLGRLYCTGFEYIDHSEIDGLVWIVTKKIKPFEVNYQASYGPIVKLKRIGKNNKIIYLLKFRTMYPYSEYLYDFALNKLNYDKIGKIANDFRITTWGKIMRRFWIDELPSLINFLKGDLKLVGVRPLSPQAFSRYPVEVQNLRIKTKPGLIPPFYADRPKSFEEIIQSEKKYLQSYLKNPILTDFIYFFKAVYNIVFKGARSA